MVRSRAMTLLLALGLLVGSATTLAKPAAKAKPGLARKTVLAVTGMT